jgi:hypothetical protein
VEQQVHEAKARRVVHQLHAHESAVALEVLLLFTQLEQVVRLGFDERIGRDQKPTGACSWNLHDLAGLRRHQPHDGVDEGPRRKVLVGDAVVAQDVAQVPKALDDFLGLHGAGIAYSRDGAGYIRRRPTAGRTHGNPVAEAKSPGSSWLTLASGATCRSVAAATQLASKPVCRPSWVRRVQRAAGLEPQNLARPSVEVADPPCEPQRTPMRHRRLR